MTKSVIIKPVISDEASHLFRQSDDYMASLYPAESNHPVDPSVLRGKGARPVGAFINDVCACCVGVRFFQGGPSYGEIKRFYADPAYRGKAIANKLMTEIRLPLLRALLWCGLKQGFCKRQQLAFMNLWAIITSSHLAAILMIRLACLWKSIPCHRHGPDC